MATFSTLNPTTIGEPTKKSDYDKVFNNTLNLSTFLGDRDLTDHGVLIGSGTAAITALATMGDGELVIGSNGADPVISALSSSTGIAITNAAGSITLGIDNAGISQAKLKTSTASYSFTSTTITYITLTGGEYSFMPAHWKSAGGAGAGFWSEGTFSNTTPVYKVYGKATGGSTIHVGNRYVTASGELFWIYMLRDKETKKILHRHISPDHISFGSRTETSSLPHPFVGFDKDKEEVIISVLPEEDIDYLHEMKGRRAGAEVLLDYFEIDEKSNPAWPNKEITVGVINNQAVKEQIAKPVDIIHRNLKRK